MSKNKQPQTNLDSVDQIRNILFGEQIATIENKFAQLEESLTNTIEALARKVEAANTTLKNQIEKSNKQLTDETTSLAQEQSSALSSLEKTINNKIVETESDLLNQIQSGIKNLDDKASHRNELAKLLTEMADKLAD